CLTSLSPRVRYVPAHERRCSDGRPKPRAQTEPLAATHQAGPPHAEPAPRPAGDGALLLPRLSRRVLRPRRRSGAGYLPPGTPRRHRGRLRPAVEGEPVMTIENR